MTLREARELAGLSQTALADYADTQAQTISDLETGRNSNPSYHLVTRIVAALRSCGLRGLMADQIFPVATKEKERV